MHEHTSRNKAKSKDEQSRDPRHRRPGHFSQDDQVQCNFRLNADFIPIPSQRLVAKFKSLMASLTCIIAINLPLSRFKNSPIKDSRQS